MAPFWFDFWSRYRFQLYVIFIPKTKSPLAPGVSLSRLYICIPTLNIFLEAEQIGSLGSNHYMALSPVPK